MSKILLDDFIRAAAAQDNNVNHQEEHLTTFVRMIILVSTLA